MNNTSSKRRTFTASPNLALVKYWGKADRELNLPATPSLGITLGDLETTTTVSLAEQTDSVFIEGRGQDPDRFSAFFESFRERRSDVYFKAESNNSFPTAAGLASSSSGFAALSFALSLIHI